MDEIEKGSLLYEWKCGNKVTMYVFLYPDNKKDKFTVEIGWSKKHTFPPSLTAFAPADPPRNGQWVMRLCRFWSDTDDWWWLEPDQTTEDILDSIENDRISHEYPIEESIAHVADQVVNVLAKIREHVIPYFKQVAARHGCQWPGD